MASKKYDFKAARRVEEAMEGRDKTRSYSAKEKTIARRKEKKNRNVELALSYRY